MRFSRTVFAMVISALVLGLMAGCSSAPTPEYEEENREVVRRYYEEVWNESRLDFVGQIFSQDFVDHSPSPNQEPGLEGFKSMMLGVHSGWDNPRFDIHELLAEGDKVSVRWTFESVFKPTGKVITYDGIETWHVREGKIAERWGNLDMLSHLDQRGLLEQQPMAPLPDPVPGVYPAEEDVEAVRRYYHEIWNEGKVELFDSLFAADFVDHNPDAGQSPDLKGFIRSVAGYRSGFPDAEFKIDKLAVEGDKIRVDWTSKGTFAPTATPVNFSGTEVWLVKDGTIRERWGEYDLHQFTAPFRGDSESEEG